MTRMFLYSRGGFLDRNGKIPVPPARVKQEPSKRYSKVPLAFHPLEGLYEHEGFLDLHYIEVSGGWHLDPVRIRDKWWCILNSANIKDLLCAFVREQVSRVARLSPVYNADIARFLESGKPVPEPLKDSYFGRPILGQDKDILDFELRFQKESDEVVAQFATSALNHCLWLHSDKSLPEYGRFAIGSVAQALAFRGLSACALALVQSLPRPPQYGLRFTLHDICEGAGKSIFEAMDIEFEIRTLHLLGYTGYK